MAKWQYYATEVIPSRIEIDGRILGLNEYLNWMADQGWELVTATSCGEFGIRFELFFKRPN